MPSSDLGVLLSDVITVDGHRLRDWWDTVHISQNVLDLRMSLIQMQFSVESFIDCIMWLVILCDMALSHTANTHVRKHVHPDLRFEPTALRIEAERITVRLTPVIPPPCSPPPPSHPRLLSTRGRSGTKPFRNTRMASIERADGEIECEIFIVH